MRVLLLLFISFNLLAVPSLQRINEEFDFIAEKYDLPAPLLKALAYKQSAWNVNHGADDELNKGMYGIMGLYQDERVSSVARAARSLNIDPIYAITSYKWNIEMSAKILAELKAEYIESGETIEAIEDYYPILVEYLDYDESIQAYARGVVLDLFNIINTGYAVQQNGVRFNVSGYTVDLTNINMENLSTFYQLYSEVNSLEEIKYRQARYYTSGRRGRKVDQVLIHIMQGYFEGTISHFTTVHTNKNRRASSHYIIGKKGQILQMVKLSDTAWHASGHNSRSVGIEHEGMDNYGATPPVTEEEYQASAKLTRWLTEKYDIPRIHRDAYHDENGHFVGWELQRPELKNLPGILGHHDTNGKEFCPGPHWDWDYYMKLLNGENPGTGAGGQTPTGGGDNDEALDEECKSNEKPAKRVHLDDYKIGKYEVTVAQYRVCVQSGACEAPTSGNYMENGRESHPINGVSWYDAQRFCSWLGEGSGNIRLPSEAEWEHAAKGDSNNIYPWGTELPTCDLTVKEDEAGNGCGENSTAEVGSKSGDTSEFGVMDMAGNVTEWTGDYYDQSYYSKRNTVINPMGPTSIVDGKVFVTTRGGEWQAKKTSSFRNSRRLALLTNVKSNGLGFRCVYKENTIEPDDNNNNNGNDGTVSGNECLSESLDLIELGSIQLPFTYSDSRDTRNAQNNCFNTYPPNSIKEYGKEYIYHFSVSKKVNASFYIEVGNTRTVDIDLQLFQKIDFRNPELIERNDQGIYITLEPGEYYLSLDSYTDPNGVNKEGRYDLHVSMKEHIEAGDDGWFNAYMLKAVDQIMANYTGRGYSLHARYTHDLNYGSEVIGATGGQKTMCSAATAETLIIAMQIYAEERNDQTPFQKLTKSKYNSQYVPLAWPYSGGANKGPGSAIHKLKLGEKLSFENLLPGALVKYDRSRSGHQVVFLAFLDADGNLYDSYPEGKTIIGFKYLSAQGSTNGMAYKLAIFSDKLSLSRGVCGTPKAQGIGCDTGVRKSTIDAGMFYMPEHWEP